MACLWWVGEFNISLSLFFSLSEKPTSHFSLILVTPLLFLFAVYEYLYETVFGGGGGGMDVMYFCIMKLFLLYYWWFSENHILPEVFLSSQITLAFLMSVLIKKPFLTGLVVFLLTVFWGSLGFTALYRHLSAFLEWTLCLLSPFAFTAGMAQVRVNIIISFFTEH